MLNWKKIDRIDDIPLNNSRGGRSFLAIHHSARYTSDVYLVWRDAVAAAISQFGPETFGHDVTRSEIEMCIDFARRKQVPRWPHGADIPITHIAEYNLPDEVHEPYCASSSS
jgi:hypothetical protein